MKKSEQWKLIKELCAEHKANPNLTKELEKLLAPKVGGSTIDRKEPIVEDGVTKLWCTKFLQYLPENDFKVYKGKPLHFCIEAEKMFNEFMKTTKSLKAEREGIMDKILEGDLDLEKGRKEKAKIDKKIDDNEAKRLGDYSKMI